MKPSFQSIFLSSCLLCTGCAAWGAHAEPVGASEATASRDIRVPSGNSESVSTVPEEGVASAVPGRKDDAVSTPSTPLTATSGASVVFDDITAAHDAWLQANDDLARRDDMAAFLHATQSYALEPSEAARTLATYAAFRWTPTDVLLAPQETPLQRALTAQIRLQQCVLQQSDCNAQSQTAHEAFEALGEEAPPLVGANDIRAPRVAVFLPLSGRDRKLGRAMLGALLQASGVYDHASLPFDLRFYDTQSSPEGIPALVEQARRDQVQLVLGPIDVQESVATARELQGDIPMIGFSPNGEFLLNPAAFQFSYSLDREAQILASFIVTLNPARVMVTGPDDPYAQAVRDQLQTYLPASIGIASEFYDPKTLDLRAHAAKIVAQAPDLVFLPTSPEAAERIASFMAQENLWCKSPGTPAPKAKDDNRKFTVCLSTSLWAVISNDHRHKALVEAIYLDYDADARRGDPDFVGRFLDLYHRMPSVYEILPFLAVSQLRAIPLQSWKDAEALRQALQTALRGQSYFLSPGFKQIRTDSVVPYTPPSMRVDVPVRTLISR